MATVNKADYSDTTEFDDTSKYLYVVGGLLTILTNTFVYRKGTKFLRRSGVKGFWAINGITAGLLMTTNSILLGGLVGFGASQQFEQTARKEGVPSYDKIKELWRV